MSKSVKTNNIAIETSSEIEQLKINTINQIIDFIGEEKTIDESLQFVCEILTYAYPYPELVYPRIIFDNKIYIQNGFKETPWLERYFFNIPGKENGSIEIFYSKDFIESSEKKVITGYSDFLKRVSVILSGIISSNRLTKIYYDNTERLKELRGINQTTKVLSQGIILEESLQEICSFLPEAWQYPEHTVARIIYEGKEFTSKGFKETQWCMRQDFSTPDHKKGSIEIYYLKEFPEDYEGPFLKEERDLIDNLAALISGVVSKEGLQELLYNNTERLKELRGINQTSAILKHSKTIEGALEEICKILPDAWQYPEFTVARIKFMDKIFESKNFRETPWVQKQTFEVSEGREGEIEIYYLKEFPELVEGPFLKEERDLLNNLASLIAGSATKIVFNKLLADNKERLKELSAINYTTKLFSQGVILEDSLQEICSFLPEAWQYPEYTAARIIYEGKAFTSKGFKETNWGMKQDFSTPDHKKGSIEIYYLKEFPEDYEGPFLKEERDLIDNLAALISGVVSKEGLQELLYNNTERLKELRGINQTSAILKQSKTIEEALEEICKILPNAWQYPEFTVARIKYHGKIFQSKKFKETKWVQRQSFEVSDRKKGVIEIFYLKEFPDDYEGPFLKEERDLLNNIASLIAGSAARDIFNQLAIENRERLKELRAINYTSEIIAQGKSINETLQEITLFLPKSWQYPRYTAAKIMFDDVEYLSKNFKETRWFQKESFVTIDNKKGTIEIFYLKEFPAIYEGPFLKEERQLLINIAKLIGGYLNNIKGREIFNKVEIKKAETSKPDEYKKSLIKDKQPLQLFFNQQIIDKYVFLDMMKYKVKEILFVATLYDAFILENEDNFFEQFMGELYQYSLFALPRITGVTSSKEALELIETADFDLVIVMVGIDTKAPIKLSKKIKQKQPDVPVYLLLNQKENISYFEELVYVTRTIDQIFVWNGDSQIFFAMIKSIEDKANVENDTKVGLVRIILLIEDSSEYYSKYLQMLYSIVFGQFQQLIIEIGNNQLDRMGKIRSRPKILLAKNYEDAVYILNKYKDFLLCVISDVEFEKDGKLDKTAGINFIKYAKSKDKILPIILQSSDIKNKKIADELDVYFLNKNSGSLLNELKQFITFHLGFGDFVFRNKEGDQIAIAKTLREFESLLHHIPEESLYAHARDNQFSLWLMARGEIQLARDLNPINVNDFDNLQEFREYIINLIKEYRYERHKGKVLSFDETTTIDERNIVSFAGGSLGGKGRGLAFINTLIYNLDFSSISNQINIRTPKTVIIGTDEYDHFIEKNKLYDKIFKKNTSYNEIKQYFIEGQLSPVLIKRLEFFIDQIRNPIAVRSSSLSEDSVTQPFAGVFDTYILTNNQSSKKTRLKILTDTIKLVYASIFSNNARSYFKAIGHKVEEERMAVILQELVGHQFDNYYYPHIAGIAQSYNYYPIAHMKPEEGFAIAAFGLGYYVVEGRNAYRFSPKYPKIEMFTVKNLINSTQVKFYALDLSKKDVDFIKEGELATLSALDMSVAEKQKTLKHCASVYDMQNDRIIDGLDTYGPRIINFPDIIKYNYIPLCETIDIMLNTFQEALGSPVEIEYAIDLTNTINNLPSFYLLQIKPLVGSLLNYSFNINELDVSKIILYTESSMGNGKVENIYDVIFIDNENFDKLKTREMAREIEYLNNKLEKQNRKYILIGPGRWGTRDQFLGIPVVWSQISNARIIVEVSLVNFPLESSLGSHFFHNVTSMNVGYFTVLDYSATDYIKWDVLKSQQEIQRTKYFIHIRFQKPLTVLMDGKKRTSVIFTDH